MRQAKPVNDGIRLKKKKSFRTISWEAEADPPEQSKSKQSRVTGSPQCPPVAEKLSRNPEDMCWDRVYEEIGRLTADKGASEKPTEKNNSKERET